MGLIIMSKALQNFYNTVCSYEENVAYYSKHPWSEDGRDGAYEYLYSKKIIEKLIAFLENDMKSKKYSDEEIVRRVLEYFEKLYQDFKKKNAVSLSKKYRNAILKKDSFGDIDTFLESTSTDFYEELRG